MESLKNSPKMPVPNNIEKAVNRKRQPLRPADPVDMDFDIEEEYVGNFLRRDVKVKDRRHLILVRDHQLEKLKDARRWYMDGTFQFVRLPFTQLYSIHAFAKRSHSVKQKPLLFVLISGRETKDNRAIFRALKELVDVIPQENVVDYERAVFKAVREVLPMTKLKACAFHANQAVYRKIVELGLSIRYINDIETQVF